jgi:hypothetical protein
MPHKCPTLQHPPPRTTPTPARPHALWADQSAMDFPLLRRNAGTPPTMIKTEKVLGSETNGSPSSVTRF